MSNAKLLKNQQDLEQWNQRGLKELAKELLLVLLFGEGVCFLTPF